MRHSAKVAVWIAFEFDSDHDEETDDFLADYNKAVDKIVSEIESPVWEPRTTDYAVLRVDNIQIGKGDED